jgi:hypothetical protein
MVPRELQVRHLHGIGRSAPDGGHVIHQFVSPLDPVFVFDHQLRHA